MTHISELAIDKLLAGEIPPADQALVRDHVGGCTRCKAAVDDAVAAKHAFAGEMPPLLLPTQIRSARAARTARTAWLAAPVLVAAAVLGLVLIWPPAPDKAEPGQQPEPVETVRTKGSSIAGLYVSHAGVVRQGANAEVVMPGDRLAFVTTTTKPLWFSVVTVDATGMRSTYVKPTKIEPGRERELPLSIELDDALGVETVTAMFCDGEIEVPGTCTSEKFTLTKVRR
jgi:hypothetical protein